MTTSASQEHIKALYDLPTVTKNNHVALRKLIDDALRHLRSLKSLGRPIEHWNDLIIPFNYYETRVKSHQRLGGSYSNRLNAQVETTH